MDCTALRDRVEQRFGQSMTLEGALIATCGVSLISFSCCFIALSRFSTKGGAGPFLERGRFFLVYGGGVVVGGGVAGALAIRDHRNGFPTVERPEISSWKRLVIDGCAVATPLLIAGCVAVFFNGISDALRSIERGAPFTPIRIEGVVIKDWNTHIRNCQDSISLLSAVLPAALIPSLLVRCLSDSRATNA